MDSLTYYNLDRHVLYICKTTEEMAFRMRSLYEKENATCFTIIEKIAIEKMTKVIATFAIDDRNLLMPMVTLVDMYYVYWSHDVNSLINMSML